MARKTKRNRDNDTYIDLIMDSPIAIMVVAVLAMLLGIVFAVSEVANKPVSREEAIAYSGTFDHYDATWENYREICFEDGSAYDVYAHTETQEFREMMFNAGKIGGHKAPQIHRHQCLGIQVLPAVLDREPDAAFMFFNTAGFHDVGQISVEVGFADTAGKDSSPL